MATPASVARHPIHPMLVVFPIGLWVTALVFDIVYVATGNEVWRTLAFYNIAAGIVGALLAAVPGFIDYLSLGGQARRVGTWHLALNLTVVAVFAVDWALRTAWGNQFIGTSHTIPLALSIVGNAILAVSGWLGGDLVYRHAVGVDTAAPRPDIRPRRAA
jgi:uncharacterized membrane protein